MAQLTFQPGEVVVRQLRPTPLGLLPAYILTLGLFEISRRRWRFLLTNQRVVISKGVLSRAVRSVPLDRVQDATLKNQLWIASIHLTSAGGASSIEAMGPLRTRDARAFLHDLTGRIGPAAPGGLTGSSSGPSIADELLKLTQLRDQGALSPEEFESQKAKLLGT
ncbi:MAG: PH domain-containing protein [Acidimicrobiales bacterium]